MSKITEAQVYFMGKAADAFGWHKRSADKAHAKCVALLNRLIDRLASMYVAKAADIAAAPYKEAAKLRDQVDVLTAIFIEEDERRRAAYKKESFALLDKAQACTSQAALGKANAAVVALHKARAELLALKK